MIKLCGLWKRKKKDEAETVYYKGHIDILGIDVLLFQNKSDHPKSPTFDLLVAKKGDPQDKQEGAKSSGTPEVEWGETKKEEEKDDIPF